MASSFKFSEMWLILKIGKAFGFIIKSKQTFVLESNTKTPFMVVILVKTKESKYTTVVSSY